VNRMARERLEGDRAHELRRGLRHYHVDFGARLGQQPRQPGRLIAGDSPRDT
jgi:hypothetical protein